MNWNSILINRSVDVLSIKLCSIYTEYGLAKQVRSRVGVFSEQFGSESTSFEPPLRGLPGERRCEKEWSFFCTTCASVRLREVLGGVYAIVRISPSPFLFDFLLPGLGFEVCVKGDVHVLEHGGGMKNSFCFITSSRTSRLLLRRKKRGVDLRPQALPARNVVSVNRDQSQGVHG
ncbi:hypothetical protein CISG_04159 [Coccidioides immitis RMSCC 3703]|uniref:Uncharacterized protein n=2 Tax=Coccidioides immitis TaxID=5501 RepID=A0A0J8QRT4_COCIT|nr:hypothetical protein CIRG_06581 [Coccidioides immitis RMSCC 2394]KMU75211.1 hypothetical protein CISG_04159 [Coccidioides immitis RMSCC 3703]